MNVNRSMPDIFGDCVAKQIFGTPGDTNNDLIDATGLQYRNNFIHVMYEEAGTLEYRAPVSAHSAQAETPLMGIK
jgi:hypothetical protein